MNGLLIQYRPHNGRGLNYEQQISRGKKHHASVRALAFKWIRILFRCWKDRVPYNEDLHLAALNKRHTPPHPTPVNLQWKRVAGFLKFSAAQS
jgi:hypothetical protein